MCLAQGPILNIPSPTKAAAKDENSHSFSSQRSHRQDISKKKAQMQTKNMNSTAVISLKVLLLYRISSFSDTEFHKDIISPEMLCITGKLPTVKNS